MSELEEIEQKYRRGELDPIKEDLERFLVAHREKIAACRAEQEGKGNPLPDDALVKYYILRHRSINPRREIADQLDEIQKEKWIRGVHSGCPPDPQAVAEDWARQYSDGWRKHRLNEIIFVFEQEKERYLRLLQRPETGLASPESPPGA